MRSNRVTVSDPGSILPKGEITCDGCGGQFFPGSSYAEGTQDVVVELWPAWEYGDAFRACLGCLRDGLSQKRQRQAESEAACHLDRLLDSVVVTRDEPESVRRSALSLAAMEAAEMICRGAVRPSETGTAVTAAGVSAGIPEPEAARIVASALHEYGEWADGQRHGAYLAVPDRTRSEPSGTEGT